MLKSVLRGENSAFEGQSVNTLFVVFFKDANLSLSSVFVVVLNLREQSCPV